MSSTFGNRIKQAANARDRLIPNLVQSQANSGNALSNNQEDKDTNPPGTSQKVGTEPIGDSIDSPVTGPVNMGEPSIASVATTSEEKPDTGTGTSTDTNTSTDTLQSAESQISRGEPMSTVSTPSQPLSYKPKRHKKERLIDTHEQKSYYIEKEIVEIIEDIVGDDTGGKYRFVNEALKLLIYQEYPEYAHRIKIK
ncbi:hypothetical protein ACFVS2_21630 [Brevibacillus sp. NPDC058079]|uniref:hypothetical protein n=1 Tax=Brevibacillus sp. NPDC058079 TaxID=3346330 RepID=UPI0036EE389A